jgi:hypothetical protein
MNRVALFYSEVVYGTEGFPGPRGSPTRASMAPGVSHWHPAPTTVTCRFGLLVRVFLCFL